MTLLNREAILGARDVLTKDVDVPEWGGALRVRSMTVAERNEFARRTGAAEDNTSIACWLIALLALDDDGNPLFKRDDVAELEKRNFKSIETVVKAIIQVNGLDTAAVEEAAKK